MTQFKNFRVILFFAFILYSNFLFANWIQQGNSIDGANEQDRASIVSMSADGNTVALGAIAFDGPGNNLGHVRVFDWNGTAWVQRGIDIIGNGSGGEAGGSVSLSADGNTVLIGARLSYNSGEVFVYDWNGTAWIQRGYSILGEANYSEFGIFTAISADGNIIAVSAPSMSGAFATSGRAYVYIWNGLDWVLRGTPIDGNGENNAMGAVSLSSDGNTLSLGDRADQTNGVDAGLVRVFDWDGAAWVQRGANIYGLANNQFGTDVKLKADGNTFVAGGRFSNRIRIYDWDGTAWAQRGADIVGNVASQLGRRVAISTDGNIVLLGASNAMRTYEWSGTNWIQRGNEILGETTTDNFGWTVAMSNDGNTIIGGAITNSNNGTNAGNARVFYYCSPPLIDTPSDIFACDNYTLPILDNGTYYTATGGSGDMLQEGETTDSTVTLYIFDTNSCGDSEHVFTVNVNSTPTAEQPLDVTACFEYTLPVLNSGNYFSAPNASGLMYFPEDVITNSQTLYVYDTYNGCFDENSFEITINEVDTAVVFSGVDLNASATNADFQWLDCDNNFAAIANETDGVFLPENSGNFAVEVTQNGCVDTSFCHQVTIVGILENLENTIIVYPNPTHDKVYLKLDTSDDVLNVSIRNNIGQLIATEIIFGQTATELTIDGSAGVYFIEVSSSSIVYARTKIIKF